MGFDSIFLLSFTESVSKSAKQVLLSYNFSFTSKIQFSDYQDNVVTPRIVQLIEELPSLVHSGRELMLKKRIDLLNGYLSMVENYEKVVQRNDINTRDKEHLLGGSSIGAALTSNNIYKIIQKAMSGKFHSLLI